MKNLFLCVGGGVGECVGVGVCKMILGDFFFKENARGGATCIWSWISSA